jgi:hypothetical protein
MVSGGPADSAAQADLLAETRKQIFRIATEV